MNQQRGRLLLILFAVMAVTGGYASPIHRSTIHDDFAFHSAYAIYSLTSPDSWLGGTGDWSDLTFWSGGLPGIASDVYINTGNDLAYLDTNATIASLTLGGTTGSSVLSSTSTTNYLIIAGALTVNQTGIMLLDSGDTVAAATLSVNSGTVNLNGGSALLIYGDASNSGSIYLGGANNLTVNGTLTNQGSLTLGTSSAANVGSLVNSGSIALYGALLQVNGGTLSNSGDIYLSTASLQVNGVVYNSGQVIQDFGSVVGVVGTLTNDVLGSIIFYGGSDQLSVQGDVNNAGLIGTGSCCFGSSDTINITGVLNNTGTLLLAGFGNTATIGSIVNSGAIGLDEYDPQHEVTRLQVNGDVSNSGVISAEGASVVNIGGTLYNSGQIYTGESGGNVVNIGGTLYNTGYFSLGGPFDSSNIGTLVNGSGGGIDVENQSSLSVNGDANNSGGMFVGGDSALSINGTLNNSGSLAAYGNADGGSNSASVGSLVNSGTIDLENGSALQVYGDASNSGSISLGSLDGGNSLGVSGTLTNQGSLALNWSDTANISNLVNSETGTINVQNGSTANVGSLANGGVIDLENGSMLQVYGDANNTGSISLGNSSGGNSLTVNGMLTNQGSLALNASDTASLGSLVNSGMIDLENGSALQVYGDASNSGSITLGAFYGGNSLTVNGMLTNQGSLVLNAYSYGGNSLTVNGTLTNQGSLVLNDSATANVSSLVNGGMIDLENGSTFSVAGDAYNGGTMTTGVGYYGGGITIGGTLENGGALVLNTDGATVGSLVNGGSIDLEDGSSLYVSGDADNSGSIVAGIYSYGFSLVRIAGNLTNRGGIDLQNEIADYTAAAVGSLGNSGTIELQMVKFVVGDDANNSGSIAAGHVSTLSIGDNLINSGSIDLENGSGLQVGGNADNSGTISMSGGDTLTIDGTLTNESLGSLVLSGYGDAATIGSIANSGVIDLEGGSTLQVNSNISNSGQISTSYYGNGGNTMMVGGRLTNGLTGTFSLDGASDVANIGSVVNQGAMYIASGATLNVTGGPRAAGSVFSGFTNTGIVNVAQNGTLTVVGNYTQTAGQTTVDGSLNVSGRGMVNFAGGVVYGNDGTISGPVISNASINIGDSLKTIGQLSFMGNYTQGPHGSLTFDIAGSQLGQYDQLNVTGHAQLNGLLTIDLLHGFVPDLGDTFDIMHFAGESGTFSLVLGLPINSQEHFILEYNPTNLTLDVVAGALLGVYSDNTGSPSAVPVTLESDATSLIASNITPDGGSRAASSFVSQHGRQSSPTPEPGTLLLLGSGLLCAGYGVRRRMTK